MNRKWSLHIEGLCLYIALLGFFWRDGKLVTAVWFFVPFMVICGITCAFETYRDEFCAEEPDEP